MEKKKKKKKNYSAAKGHKWYKEQTISELSP